MASGGNLLWRIGCAAALMLNVLTAVAGDTGPGKELSRGGRRPKKVAATVTGR